MTLKVRPFNTAIDDESGEGKIDGSTFVCYFYGRPFPMEATSVGEDELGPFALIQETQRPERFGYTFKKWKRT
jgi:hypothetical protein